MIAACRARLDNRARDASSPAGMLAALLLATFSWPSVAAGLLLTNAHLVDPATKTIAVAHVHIEGAKVVEISTEPPPGFDGEIVDLQGKYLLPGLVDAHVHSGWNRGPIGAPDEELGIEETARRMLIAGVTAYLDLGSHANRIFPVRDEQRLGNLALAADIYAAGPVFVSIGRPGAGNGPIIVQTRAEARRELDRLAAKHPDVIKLVFDWARERRTMDEEVMRALVGHAQELHLKTVVHIGTWENARLAVDAGATAITHLDDTAEFPEALTEAMAAKHVFSIPTMAVQQDFLDILEDHRLLDNPLLRLVAGEDLLNGYRALDPNEFANCPTCRWQREGRKHYGISLSRLAHAGAPIVAGSDSGNLGTFQGFSLHRELILLHQWGLSAWDALAAGTSRAYELLGLNIGFSPGADATFLVLSASPLDDIANTQRIERILFHGQWVDRTALVARH
jgi:imidazolonepropionase-like amidohydrolase